MLVLPALGGGCVAKGSVSAGASVARHEQAIRDFARQYAEAFAAEDADAVVALMTDDFVAITPDKPPVIGKTRVHAAIVADLAEMAVERVHFAPSEIAVCGDWAWAWGIARGAVRTGDNGDRTEITGKFLWILKRQPNGTWKIARDCAHGDVGDGGDPR
jgi:uncharacterized protein (TIGR02246 family)